MDGTAHGWSTDDAAARSGAPARGGRDDCAAPFHRPVRRRKVFYIPGYDPFHARRYRELYRREGAAQAAISGHALAIAPLAPGRTEAWRVEARIEGREVTAEIEVLVWSDLVKASMQGGVAASYAALLRTAGTYLSSGALWRLARLRKGPVIAALYPVVALVGQALVAALLGVFAGWMALQGLAARLPLSAGAPVVAGALAGAASLAAGAAALGWFKRHDGRLFVHYLMRDFAFAAARAGAYPADLEARLADWRARLSAALREGWDEVLVVGHSSGASLAISLVADTTRAVRSPVPPPLALLTLGQVVPMLSFLPGAERLRGDLRALSLSEAVTWVDVTAPGDGCTFALCDPVAVSGVAPPSGQRGPLVISAAFSRSLSPPRWRALRWRFFRLHFQYLCAFDAPDGYDYFAITAGPRSLAARHAGRPASRARVSRAVNRHTGIA